MGTIAQKLAYLAQTKKDIAAAIRNKGVSVPESTTFRNYAAKIGSISGTVIEQKSIDENGTYTAPAGVDGYSPVVVNVPNTYAAGDEGKVVENGALVAQTSKSISENGTHDTTKNNQVVVSVPNSYAAGDEGKVVDNGALVAQTSIELTESGTYDTTKNNEVVVNVSGGILSGTDAPSASLGSNGDLYVQKMDLPDNVNFVEYLQSSGTQYIDTGIKANQGTDVMFDIGWKSNDFCFGARTGSASSFTKALFGVGGSENGFGIGRAGSTSKDFSPFRWSGYSTNERIKARTKKIDRSQSQVGTGQYKNLCQHIPNGNHTLIQSNFDDYTCDYNQILFGIGQGSTPTTATSARIYRITYYQDGTPIADYLPCLDTNDVPCMWDNIAKEYVYNDGTGTFTYGNTATPDKISDVLYEKKNGAWVYVGEVDDVNT